MSNSIIGGTPRNFQGHPPKGAEEPVWKPVFLGTNIQQGCHWRKMTNKPQNVSDNSKSMKFTNIFWHQRKNLLLKTENQYFRERAKKKRTSKPDTPSNFENSFQQAGKLLGTNVVTE